MFENGTRGKVWDVFDSKTLQIRALDFFGSVSILLGMGRRGFISMRSPKFSTNVPTTNYEFLCYESGPTSRGFSVRHPTLQQLPFVIVGVSVDDCRHDGSL